MNAEDWYAADIAARAADLAFRQAQHAKWVEVSVAGIAAQNARAAAEQAMAQAVAASAAAQTAMSAAMTAAMNLPPTVPSDAQLLREFAQSILAGGGSVIGAMTEARALLSAYRLATRPPTPAPK